MPNQRGRQQEISPAAKAGIDALTSMWASIDAARVEAGLDVLVARPPNGFTASEYAKKYGVPEPTARNHMASMLARGVVTMVRVLLPSANAKMTPMNVYVPVGK